MKIIYETRFSFFGQSGWKSTHSADPDLLFAEDRLANRFEFFEKITLESLKGQTDPDYQHFVLSSSLMPEAWRKRLRELCFDVLGKERARVMFRPEGSAGHLMKKAVADTFGREKVVQVVLDDDDAVSHDFNQILRAYATLADSDPVNTRPYCFVSFPRGHTLGIEDGKMSWLSPRYVPYTNLGLALVGPGTTKRNPFLTSHKKVGERHPSLMVTHQRPFYLRAVHGLNDSNAHISEDFLSPDQIREVFVHFPWLEAHFSGLDKEEIAAQ